MKYKRDLTFLERIYIQEILRGMWVTCRHFTRNLLVHSLHCLGLMKKVPADVTFQYPEERRPLAPRLRTRHRLNRRADGTPRCVACMLCETICPSRCIAITATEHPDPNIEKVPRTFHINLGRCVFCGLCVEVCPVDAIRMDTHILDIASSTRQDMVLDIDNLLDVRPCSETTVSHRT